VMYDALDLIEPPLTPIIEVTDQQWTNYNNLNPWPQSLLILVT
jgi:hypothetical protein